MTVRIKWHREAVYAAARTCNTKDGFYRKYGAAYNAAKADGYLVELFDHMGWAPPKKMDWTVGDVIADARRFRTAAEWKRESHKGYRKATQLGCRAEASAHFDYELGREILAKKVSATKLAQHAAKGPKWSDAELIKSAKPFMNPKAWKDANPNFYRQAMDRGLLPRATAHMTDKLMVWTEESIWEAVAVCDTNRDFREEFPSAYNAARDMGILDEINASLEKHGRYTEWSREKILASIEGFDTITDWYHAHSGARKAAERLGMVEEIRDIIGVASAGFDPESPGQLYYVKVQTDVPGEFVYKIGITVFDNLYRRFQGDMWRVTVLKTWAFDRIADAKDRETMVKETFKEFAYTGPKFMSNWGETEMFYKDVLGLDREVA
ncbi:hypothetical protein [Ruegeria sp. HKCCD7318]|uniref:hypothetical protein n=1 Tax=Ruegeria sp. HKCCD7318 TaxID=2683014 RepID=UPI001491AC28|nr:hypothetical protein [Ruegeria sp. HKCCD7318]NOE32496.1 hypothetical protein [Ruegeria sp. HKCCD7318]